MIMDQLTKSSTSEEIKEYFNAILALKEKNELYPVNIDRCMAACLFRERESYTSVKS